MTQAGFSKISGELWVIIVLVAIAAFLAGFSVGRQYRFSDEVIIEPGIIEPAPPVGGIEPAPDEGIACTLDAKICPDGSAVGRQGPNCEFAPCPGEVQ